MSEVNEIYVNLVPTTDEQEAWACVASADFLSEKGVHNRTILLPEMFVDVVMTEEVMNRHIVFGYALRHRQYGVLQSVNLVDLDLANHHLAERWVDGITSIDVVMVRPPFFVGEPLASRWMIHALPLTKTDSTDDHRDAFYRTLHKTLSDHAIDTNMYGLKMEAFPLVDWCRMLAAYCVKVSELTGMLGEHETIDIWADHWMTVYDEEFMPLVYDEVTSVIPRAVTQ